MRRRRVTVLLGITAGALLLCAMWADSGWRQLLVAVGTIALAMSAFWSTRQSMALYHQQREDETRKEKRDRDERLLNEIIAWAQAVLAIATEYRLLTIWTLIGLRTRIHAAHTAKDNMATIASRVHPCLTESVIKANSELDGLKTLVDEDFKQHVHPTIEAIVGSLEHIAARTIEGKPVSDDLQRAFGELIEYASEVKTRL